MKKYHSVEEYIEDQHEHCEFLQTLREIVLSTGLEETVKWAFPVYTLQGKNIVGLGATKSYTGIWFFQGTFLKDEKGKLINAQEGTTRGMRQWRFRSPEELDEDLLKAYIFEAIENQKQGKQIKPKRKPLIIPEELQNALNQNKRLGDNFENMNLTKKREFAEYIATAKREETRMKRLEKIIPMILANRGLNDKYRS